MEVLNIIAFIGGAGGFAWIIKLLIDMNKSIGKMEADRENLSKRLEENIGYSNNKFEKLPCTEHSNNTNAIKEDIAIIRTFLIEKYSKSSPVFFKKNSPTSLNEMGEKLFNDINGDSFIKENKMFFINEIDKKEPKTPLDVEDYAKQVLLANLKNDIFNEIKNYVYNAPCIEVKNESGEIEKYTITMQDICYILSIPLRDTYLEKNKL
jgi:hypothetical protein